MALSFSLPLHHPKSRYAFSLVFFTLIIAAIFLGKQSVSVLSQSLSTFSNFSLLRSPIDNPSSSLHLLTLPPTLSPPPPPTPSLAPPPSPTPPPRPGPQEEGRPICSPFLSPPPVDYPSEADDDDVGKDEHGIPLPYRPPSKDPQLNKSVPAPSPVFERAIARAAHREDPAVRSKDAKKCDLYKGTWVKDEEGIYPLYAPGSCPYVDEAFSCQENGRQDDDYLKWRWKPDDCELPRFNATDFLERLRGKRLMLVGDSMNRNQFESMLCILREALPDKSRMHETRGYKITKGRGYFIFLFSDYNCTISFVRSHFLVREGRRFNGQRQSSPILMIDRIGKSSARWKAADILVFNTGHWWSHGKTSRGKDYYKEGDVIYSQMNANEAFKRAMQTWGSWIDRNMDPAKKMVFFRGYSTAHFRVGDWDSGGTCHGETGPAFSGSILDSYPPKMKIIEEVRDKMNFPLFLLNVTKLTNYRKDAHPSIYGKKVMEGERFSRRRQDCSHWCLPGIPDAWNELIYATLVLENT